MRTRKDFTRDEALDYEIDQCIQNTKITEQLFLMLGAEKVSIDRQGIEHREPAWEYRAKAIETILKIRDRAERAKDKRGMKQAEALDVAKPPAQLHGPVVFDEDDEEENQNE
jgi:hypothetical protein